jgi:hypothetical protein
MMRGSEASSKINTSLNELQEADKVIKLPKVSGKLSCDFKNPVLYDYSTYRLNAWEDDKAIMKKYKDFMKKPVDKLDRMKQKLY